MTNRTSAIAGVGLLLGAALIILLVVSLGGGGGEETPPGEVLTLRGRIGSEKAGFLDDPDVKRILRERYQLSIDYSATGSLKLVQADATGQDFLWPGSQSARELFEEATGTTPKSAVIFNSPIVVYAWRPVTDALAAVGIVETANGAQYLDVARLAELIEAGKQWSDVGLSDVTGPILLYTTDPTKSNSGNLFAGLLANTFAGGQVVDDSTVGTVLPRIERYYSRLGYMEESTGFLFDQFLARGIGSYPMIVGYENQMIEYALEHESLRDQLSAGITILYLKPSVWAAHTLIAISPQGQRLIDAFQDRELQELAWSRHGFRSGLAGSQDVPDFLEAIGIPAQLTGSAMPIPRAGIMEQITARLAAASGATPPPLTATP